MKPSLLHRLDSSIRHMVPLATTIAMLLLMVVPSRVPGFAPVVPAFLLMAVYYWAIFRPDLLPGWVAFVVGLIYDAVAGLPLGVTALVLLLTHGVVASQRRFFLGNTFIVAWSAFAMVAAAAALTTMALVWAAAGRASGGERLVVQYLLTLLLYPPMASILARAQVAFLRGV